MSFSARDLLLHDPKYSPWGGVQWGLREHHGLSQPRHYRLERLGDVDKASVLILTPVLKPEERHLLNAILQAFQQAGPFMQCDVHEDPSQNALNVEAAQERIQSFTAMKIICFGWWPASVLRVHQQPFEQCCGQTISFLGTPTLILEDLKHLFLQPRRKRVVWKQLHEFFAVS